MARNFRSSPAKKIGRLKSPKLDSSQTKRLVPLQEARKRFEKMSVADLYSFVETAEQERVRRALLWDPLEEQRRNLIERALAFLPDLEASKQPLQMPETKKRRSR